MRLDRRRFIGLAGASVGGAVLGAGVGQAVDGGTETAGASTGKVPFHGTHQAGIVTPVQDRLHIAAFDVVPGVDRAGLQELLRTWTDAAREMTAGRFIGPVNEQLSPPEDTGEAEGLAAADLTVTFGLGPTLFERHGRDRFGIARQRPRQLRPLESLPGDELEAERSGGDLCVQACANDPQVAFHAVRNLARLGRGTVIMRWSQLGFGKTSRTSSADATPRNLMGFKDGTRNITSDETAALDKHVWVGGDSPGWMRGGTFMVTRRIRMLIEVWDRAQLADQEATIGRTKRAGAPLGHLKEHDPLDLDAKDPQGKPRIPIDAHVRLAAAQVNSGVRILRRGYSFTDGFDPELGQLDAGLFFIAFQRDPAQFVALQRRLGTTDALNEYIKHRSSAVFAVPGGVRRGRYVAQGLFE